LDGPGIVGRGRHGQRRASRHARRGLAAGMVRRCESRPRRRGARRGRRGRPSRDEGRGVMALRAFARRGRQGRRGIRAMQSRGVARRGSQGKASTAGTQGLAIARIGEARRGRQPGHGRWRKEGIASTRAAVARGTDRRDAGRQGGSDGRVAHDESRTAMAWPGQDRGSRQARHAARRRRTARLPKVAHDTAGIARVREAGQGRDS